LSSNGGHRDDGSNKHLDVIAISLQISRQNEKNLKSTNIRSIIIQIQNMNIKLNMKDINKILAKAHLEYKYLKKMM
jgi:hypothetical protein